MEDVEQQKQDVVEPNSAVNKWYTQYKMKSTPQSYNKRSDESKGVTKT
jgi:hypothetical protein